jgi:hypothetical protein
MGSNYDIYTEITARIAFSNETYRHDITEILLKVALNTTILNPLLRNTHKMK